MVIGLAGHVDHGKTWLVRALTGYDTDRLPEEKRRGMTIEPGFAPLTLLDGRRAGLIDLPGHGGLIGNMLSGCGGLDGALITVAADEGVMPQTREHLELLGLLGVPSGVVALTKTDAAGPELTGLTAGEVEELIRGTFLEGAPILPVSAKTGEGMDALLAALSALPSLPRSGELPFYLPVDRVFEKPGAGVIITGTVMQGALCRGETVEIGGQPARVRGLQVFGEQAGRVEAGSRAALSLGGPGAARAARGLIAAAPGYGRESPCLDVYLRGKIKNACRLRLYLGPARRVCRVSLYGRETLEGEGYARLWLDKPAVSRRGERFILRSLSPEETLGGGEVLDARPFPRRRGDPGAPDYLRRMRDGDAGERLQAFLEEQSRRGLPLAEIAPRLGLTEKEAQAAAEALKRAGRAVRAGGVWRSKGWLLGMEGPLREILEGYHRAHPLEQGMNREELKKRLGLDSGALLWYERAGVIRLCGGFAALGSFSPHLSPAGEARRAEILKAFQSGGFTPPDKAAFAGPVLEELLRRGELIDCGGVLFSSEACRRALERFLSLPQPVTLAAFRDALGASRRYASALLTHWDALGLTLREGDARRYVGEKE